LLKGSIGAVPKVPIPTHTPLISMMELPWVTIN